MLEKKRLRCVGRVGTVVAIQWRYDFCVSFSVWKVCVDCRKYDSWWMFGLTSVLFKMWKQMTSRHGKRLQYVLELAGQLGSVSDACSTFLSRSTTEKNCWEWKAICALYFPEMISRQELHRPDANSAVLFLSLLLCLERWKSCLQARRMKSYM